VKTVYELQNEVHVWQEVTREEYLRFLERHGISVGLKGNWYSGHVAGRIRTPVPMYDLAEMQADAAKVGFEFVEMGEGTPHIEWPPRVPREL
jgi:hypothetical protein